MPKVHNTRKQRAAELLRDVINGPSFSHVGPGTKPFTEEQAAADYKLYSESWIIPRLKELVPELRPKKGKQ